MSRTKRRRHSEEFKREALKLVTEQGYSLAEAVRNLGIHVNLLRTWKSNRVAAVVLNRCRAVAGSMPDRAQ